MQISAISSKLKKITIEPLTTVKYTKKTRVFIVEWINLQKKEMIEYNGKKIVIAL
jgi:hypothetical protein